MYKLTNFHYDYMENKKERKGNNMSRLEQIFSKICKMERAYAFKNVSNFEREVKILIEHNKVLWVTYKNNGEDTSEELFYRLFINKGLGIDYVREKRSFYSFDEFLKIIREYNNPINVMYVLETFARENGFICPLSMREYGESSLMYEFHNMIVLVDTNCFGTKYLKAYKGTKDDFCNSNYQYIERVEELNRFYKNCK